MNAKIRSLGVVVFIFVTWSIIYYEIVIETVSSKRQNLELLNTKREQLLALDDEVAIRRILREADDIYSIVGPEAEPLYSAFGIIQILCLMNLTFLL